MNLQEERKEIERLRKEVRSFPLRGKRGKGITKISRTQAIATWILSGAKPKEVREMFGISIPTLSAVLQSEEFNIALEELQESILGISQTRISFLAPEAIDTLHALMSGAENEAVQLKAAKAILNAALLGGEGVRAGRERREREEEARENRDEREMNISYTSIIIQAYEKEKEKREQPKLEGSREPTELTELTELAEPLELTELTELSELPIDLREKL